MKKIRLESIIALGVFLIGLGNMWFALFLSFPDKFEALREIFPLYLLHVSRSITFLSGVIITVLAYNIAKRKKRAWSILIVLFALSTLLQIIKDFDIWEALLNALMLFVLWHYRTLFTVGSESWKKLRGLKIASLWLLGVLLYAIFGFFIFAKDFSQAVTLPRIIHDYAYTITGIGIETLRPTNHNSHWFVGSITPIALLGLTLGFSSFFWPYVAKNNLTEDDLTKIKQLLATNSTSSSGYFALLGDKQIFFNTTKTCFVAYKIVQKTAIILGDPVGKKIYWEGIITEFREFAHTNGLSIGLSNASDPGIYTKLGFGAVKVGEEAVVSTQDFTLEGPLMGDVRHSMARMKREKVEYQYYRMSEIPWRVLSTVDNLHSDWMSSKRGPALGFSVDFYPFPIEHDGYVVTAMSSENKLICTLSFLPVGPNKLVLELMMRAPHSPNGVVEATLGESILHFREMGYAMVSLGLAPLSDQEQKANTKLIDKSRKFVFEHFNKLYGYKPLFIFKKKFNPVWEDRYLIYESPLLLPTTVSALVLAHTKK